MIVVTKGLTIRPFTAPDARMYQQNINHPKILWMIWGRKKPYTRKDAKSHMQNNIRRYKNIKHLIRNGTSQKISYAIELHGMVIGGIGFTPDRTTAEIGYWIAQSYWGQGIMPKVLNAFCKYLMQTYQIRTFEAKTFTFNLRSGRVLEKVGFKKIYQAIHDEKINGRRYDHLYFQKVV